MTATNSKPDLLLDVGNTNVAWGWDDGKLFGFGQAEHASMAPPEIIDAIAGAGYEPGRILMAGVAGSVEKAIAAALTRHFGVDVIEVKVRTPAHGLRVGYRQPDSLGVDRWLAMIGAINGYAGPVCVADAGTALTVDAVLSGGQHLGGVIAPGIEIMRSSVLSGTEEIAPQVNPLDTDNADACVSFADNTAAAVRSGAIQAAAGLIEHVAAELDQVAGEPARVFLTGGAAGIIAPVLRRDVHVLRELVLRGLSVVAQS